MDQMGVHKLRPARRAFAIRNYKSPVLTSVKII